MLPPRHWSDATWPLLIPIETVAPLVQACIPRGDPDIPCAVEGRGRSRRCSQHSQQPQDADGQAYVVAKSVLTAVPLVPTRSTSQIVVCETVIEITSARSSTWANAIKVPNVGENNAGRLSAYFAMLGNFMKRAFLAIICGCRSHRELLAAYAAMRCPTRKWPIAIHRRRSPETATLSFISARFIRPASGARGPMKRRSGGFHAPPTRVIRTPCWFSRDLCRRSRNVRKTTSTPTNGPTSFRSAPGLTNSATEAASSWASWKPE